MRKFGLIVEAEIPPAMPPLPAVPEGAFYEVIDGPSNPESLTARMISTILVEQEAGRKLNRIDLIQEEGFKTDIRKIKIRMTFHEASEG